MADITFIEGPYSMQEGSGAPSRSMGWPDQEWYPAPQSPAAERQVFQVGLDEGGLSGMGDLLAGNAPLILAVILGGIWLWSRSESGSGLKGLGDGGFGGGRRRRAPRQEVTLKSPVGELSLLLRTDR